MDSGPLTQAQALALLRRTSDDSWLSAELSSPDGTAVINSRTAIAEATSIALQAQVDACAISTAPGGRPGVCVLTLTRKILGTFVDIPAGYPFRTNEGIDLRVSQPVTMSSTDYSVDLYLETLRFTELVNTYVPAFDALLSVGDIMATGTAAPAIFDYIYVGTVKTPGWTVLGPGATNAYRALRYVSSTLITLSASDWLSVHGNERGQRRQPGEDVEEYRARIRLFPDAVSPIAVSTAIHAVARNAGLPNVTLLEPINPLVSPGLLAEYSLGFFDSSFCDDGFCDDVVETPGLREARAYFRESVDGVLHEPDGSVLYCDDGFCDDEVWGYPDVGMHPQLVKALWGIREEARVKRAAGVQFDIYVECSQRLDADADTAPGPGGAIAWTLTPPTGKAWMIRDGRVTANRSNAGINPFLDALAVEFTYSDATVLTSPWSQAVDGIPLRTFELERMGYRSEQVVSIVGRVKSASLAHIRLVGTFWVTEVTL
jgi:hypothetical protein